MTRVDRIRQVLCEILYRGLLNIRGYARQQNADACFAEADHLHNLPHLIANFREELLTFYCETERRSFVNRGGNPERYAELWQRLDELRAANESA